MIPHCSIFVTLFFHNKFFERFQPVLLIRCKQRFSRFIENTRLRSEAPRLSFDVIRLGRIILF